MTQENVDLLRSLYAAFSGLAEGGDVAAYVRTHYDPACEYEPVEEHGTVRGHDALVGWNERWFEAWDEFRVDVDELIEGPGGTFAVALTAHGATRDGMQVDQRIFHTCEMRDGKVFRIREFLDRADALRTVGRLRESGP